MKEIFCGRMEANMEMERNLLLKEIKRLLRLATDADLDLIWRFVRKLVT
jgi:hypothetical protein